MTRHYLGEWLDGANHYRMQLLGDAADNPDQRITETSSSSSSRPSPSASACSSRRDAGLLRGHPLGPVGGAPLHVFGIDLVIPGYLVWGALIYAIFGTVLTHRIGAPLVDLNFQQQRYEADFRFNLVRVRENAEQIALLKGESAERGGCFIASATSSATGTHHEPDQAPHRLHRELRRLPSIFPYVLVAPAYFAGKIQLGGMMQTASAFSSVQGALSFFVTAYRTLAEWRSIVARLDGFEMAVDAAANLPRARAGDRARSRRRHRDDRARRAAACSCRTARRWSQPTRFAIQPAERVAGHRPVGLRQVDAVPGHRRHLAVRHRHDRHPGEGEADDVAAAALFPGRRAGRRGRLSRPTPAHSSRDRSGTR